MVKTDALDAVAAAHSVLAQPVDMLARPRAGDGIRQALSVLLASRRRRDGYRTIQRNALNALTRTNELGIDARRALTDSQITRIASWRKRETDSLCQGVARGEAVSLARSIRELDGQLRQNKQQIAALCDRVAPGMQHQVGCGPITVATILIAYSNDGRSRSEAAFASLAGTAPLPASSGEHYPTQIKPVG